MFVLIVLGLLYGGMSLGGVFSPALGLDLRGGTTVTLTAHSSVKGQTISSSEMKSDLKTAVGIMRERVNGLGVGNAEVETEGSNNIVVSVPGKNAASVLDSIGQTALLSLRQVYESNAPGNGPPATTVQDTTSSVPGQPPASAPPSGSPSAPPSNAPSSAPSGTSSSAPSTGASPKAIGGEGSSASGDFHAQAAAFVRDASTSPSPTSSASSTDPAGAAPSAAPSSAPDAAKIPAKPETTPTQAELDAYKNLDCTNPKNQQGDSNRDIPTKFLVTCGAPDQSSVSSAKKVWYKYMLYPTLVQGKDISSASAEYSTQNAAGWSVQLTFKSGAANTWAKFTAAHVGTLTSIVLDGNVMSTEVIQSAITGPTQITGNFSHSDASNLSNILKYGALPLAFNQANAQTISPTLGSTQLRAGMYAGALGLILVLLYSLFYYRGLALVTILSLALSAAIQYPIIVLLGKGIGYTLTLAGIAGLIVAVGVTADSFIVYFERLRDEVRDGNTLRSAVERGWIRARRTIVSADVVSLIAALVLYWLAIGDVRGFAFTLGLSTFVDLFIVFFFTKPLITLLARTRFFGEGHRFSGLDAERLGVDRLKPVASVTRRAAPARRS